MGTAELVFLTRSRGIPPAMPFDCCDVGREGSKLL